MSATEARIPDALRICAVCENDVASAEPVCERCRREFEADRERLIGMLRETEKDRSALLATIASVDCVLRAAAETGAEPAAEPSASRGWKAAAADDRVPLFCALWALLLGAIWMVCTFWK